MEDCTSTVTVRPASLWVPPRGAGAVLLQDRPRQGMVRLRRILPMRTTTIPATQLRNAHLHAPFLAILPRIEAHGNVYFRHLKCSHRKEEALAEMRALAWKWFVRLAQRGKDPTQFVSAIAAYAARAVNSGRRVCGVEKAKDVLSRVAQRRHGFAVE